MIYLDNSSTTKPLEEVCLAMDRSMRREWGNPSSIHKLGYSTEKQIKECKIVLSEILSCDPQEILFTSCGTESTNTVLKGFWDAYPRTGKHMITSLGEHKATSETCRYLQRKGVEVAFIPLNQDGTIDLDRLPSAIKPETSLLSFIHVNNETGAVLDVAKLIRIRNQYCPEARIHLDCVQSFGKQKERIGRLGVDYASISAHKIHGPKGIGILYHRKSAKTASLIHGGGQQKDLRSGTENLPSIVGMMIAAKDAYKEIETNYQKTTDLGTRLLTELEKMDIAFRRISPKDGSPYILNLSFPGIKGETMLHTLESMDLYVSTQSACSSKKQHASPILLAMGIEPKIAESSIRFSFDRFNTMEEILQTVIIIKDAIAFLSPNQKNRGIDKN